MDDLNKKIWFRVLTVIFFFAFIFAQIVGVAITFNIAGKEKFVDNPATYSIVGEQLKEKYPEYLDLTDEEVGKLFSSKKPLTQEEFNGMIRRGFTTLDIVNLLDKTMRLEARYSNTQKAGFYVLSFVVISLIFFVAARIFLYVVLGAPIIGFRFGKQD